MVAFLSRRCRPPEDRPASQDHIIGEKGSSDDEKILCIDDKRFDGSVSHLLL